jgi:hypothetical protein
MRTLIEILASLASLANAVIYGTDVVGAIVLRPAIAAVDDRTLSAAAAALATLALVIFLAIYNRVSKPVNTALTAAALADRVPRTLANSRPAGTQSSTRASRCRASPSPRYASRSPRSDRFEAGVRAASPLRSSRNPPICQPEGTNEQPDS